MKLTADKGIFSDAFHLVMGAVPAKTPKDILLTVQVKAEGDSLELCATDLDIGIKTRIQNVKIEEEGVFNLLASKTSQILKKSQDEVLSINETDDKIKIKIGRNRFNLVSMDPSDFPLIQDFPDENTICINGETLKELISRTVFSTSKDTSRWAMNGVLFNLEKNLLEAVATDSKRLAHFKTEVENKSGNSIQVIIPSRALLEVNKTLEGKDQKIEIALTEKQAFFNTGKSHIVTRLVDGKFPPYKQVLPSDLSEYKKISVPRVSLTQAIDQASIFISESSMAIKMELEADEMFLKSRSIDSGDSEISLKLDEALDENIMVGFNPHYVMEFLKVIPQDTVEFLIKDSKSMGVLIAKGDDNYKYLVMPVSLEF